MSLKTRALVAVLLMVGFYTLSLATSAILLWIPYAMWTNMESFPIKVALACVISAGVILWSILPRRDRFEAPGPRISEADHPRLFAEIGALASRTSQRMPSEVYLIPDVNAWVAQRGGIMGIGSRRVMALGVPLMGLLTVSQFRAVLAHEFGHYHAGDTRLGPWIYKTRGAIVRTVESLAQRNSLVAFLFHWYANMFLKVTLAISRAQEYAADRLAAQIGGANSIIDGLKQLHVGSVAWGTYLKTEVVPVLSEGFSPPLSRGFNHFLLVVREATAESLSQELAEGKADTFDTHPALPERIAALGDLPPCPEEDRRPAIELLENPDAADCRLFLSDETVLEPITWERAVEDVWVRKWTSEVSRQSEAIADMSVSDLPEQLAGGHFKQRCKSPGGLLLDAEQRAQHAVSVASFALSLALMRDGWRLHALPGETYLEKNGEKIEPFKIMPNLASGEVTAAAWSEKCARWGVANLNLIGTAAASA